MPIENVRAATGRDDPRQGSQAFALVDRLQTDALEDRYGLIRAQVLHHGDGYRAAHLVDSPRVSRTFALTLLPPSGVEAPLRRLDDRLHAAGSMGKTFREQGFVVRKNVLRVFVAGLPPWLRHAFQSDDACAKARVSEFVVRRAACPPMVFGVVVEIDHPGFRPAVLRPEDQRQEAPSFTSLLRNGVKAEEVWRRHRIRHALRHGRSALRRSAPIHPSPRTRVR